MPEIAIIGGGAGGMMATLTAAENPENRVRLFERQARVGRKLLSTGNGRCNLTNLHCSPAHYHSETPEFMGSALEAFPVSETLQWFRDRGLVTVAEESGRVYPLSNSANSVLDVLRLSIQQSENITLYAAAPVLEIKRTGTGFTVKTEQESFHADKVIVACGGMAGSKLGGVKDGYALLQSLGHSRTGLHPALVQLTTETEYPKRLKGVRADAKLTLASQRKTLIRTEGEVQFTEKGVSGPAVFDLSRAASVSDEKLQLTLDFLRGYGIKDVFSMLVNRRDRLPGLPAEELLTGVLHNRLGRTILHYVNLDTKKTLDQITDSELKEVARACKGFTLPVKGTEGFDSAQVTAGGVRCSEFDSDTMESKLVPGLYACGEVLDVDGDCGGFNLQWAWASGHLAGRLL